MQPDRHAGSYRGLYVDIYPPSLRAHDRAHVPGIQLSRPAEGAPSSGDLVYVTFGTLFNRVDDRFRSVVKATAAVADRVLVTVGRGGAGHDLGELPANVSVEEYVPQAEVLPGCAAVICHGGSGTVLAALAHAVPVLCLPQGADQFVNATSVSRVGAGASLVGDEVTEPAVRRALEQILGSAGARAAALDLAEEIAQMPSAAEVALAVERHAVVGP